MILVRGHPGADVRLTVAKHNAISGLVVAQIPDGVPIGEDQIRQVQHHDGTAEGRLRPSTTRRFAVLTELHRVHLFPVAITVSLEENCRAPAA